MRGLRPARHGDERRNAAASARPAGRDDIAALVARLADDASTGRHAKARQVSRLAALLAGSARRAGASGVTSGQWLADLVVDVAPRIPVRGLATLRRHYDGLVGDDLASALVASAARATATVGAAGGALAGVDLAAPPTLLSTPVLIAAETLAVVAVEVKLVAELHAVYGRPAAGTRAQRGVAYAVAWAHRRGIEPLSGGALHGVVSSTARREMRARVLRRAGRNMSTLAPFLAGAVAGAELNRRETRKLAEQVARDLGGRLR